MRSRSTASFAKASSYNMARAIMWRDIFRTLGKDTQIEHCTGPGLPEIPADVSSPSGGEITAAMPQLPPQIAVILFPFPQTGLTLCSGGK